MKPDSITRYVTLRNSLLREKAALEARLEKINRALSGMGTRSSAVQPTPGWARGLRLARNKMSLKAAIAEVTRNNPLTKIEILGAVKKLGYKFATKDPIGSLNTQLYTRGQFKNVDGKFSPAK